MVRSCMFTLLTRCVQPNVNKCLCSKDSKHACYFFYAKTESLTAQTKRTPFPNDVLSNTELLNSTKCMPVETSMCTTNVFALYCTRTQQ